MKFFPYSEGDEFNGILYNSQQEFEVLHTIENYNDNRIQYLYDKDPQTFSCLARKEYNYYHFKFLRYNVKLTSYSIQNYQHMNESWSFPKTWVLSGFDGKNWINISTVADSKFENINEIRTYKTDIVKPFKDIKITQTGDSYSYPGYELLFCIANIEFHGYIGFDHTKVFMSIYYKNIIHSLILCIML